MSLHGVDVRKEQFTTGTLLCRCAPLHVQRVTLLPVPHYDSLCPSHYRTSPYTLLALRHSLTLCLVELFVELSWLDKSHELANFVKSNNCTGKLQCDSNPSNPGHNYIICEAPPFVCRHTFVCVCVRKLCATFVCVCMTRHT